MELLVFDLDGTLLDTTLDLANSVNATRLYLGLAPLPIPLVASYVGNGVPVLVRKSLGAQASDQQVDDAITYFMAWYRDHMLEHTRPYPGVIEGLDLCHREDRKMAVLTNKPVRFSQTLLTGLNMTSTSSASTAATVFPRKSPTPSAFSN